MGKTVDAREAAGMVKDGMTVMMGGFLGVGSPEKVIDALLETSVKELTVIVNDTAFPEKGVGRLVVADKLARVLTSHIGTNKYSREKMNSGELKVELIPQGTLAEQIRAGGAGLGGVLTPTGIGTVAQEGKKIIKVDGKDYILALPLTADVALLKAHKGDELGNLVYRRSARNFNPIMAMAAKTVIAEVEELVGVGEIDPDQVITPGIFVDYLVNGKEG